MGVSMRHVFEQGPMLRSLGASALTILTQGEASGAKPECPGPWISAEVAAPSDALVKAFVRNAGGDPSSYRGRLPPHLFPQWGLPFASRALAGLPYPLAKVLNAGARFEVMAPLPAGERLQVKARLESIDDDGTRAILTTRIVTGTASAPNALIAHVHAFVPLAKKAKKAMTANGAPKPAARASKSVTVVPSDAREIAYSRLAPNAGLDFAKLTGDFNPIHWVPAYARGAGFRGCILHGFGTFALAVEAISRRVLSGDIGALRSVEARFTKPLLLPGRAGVYVGDVHEGKASFFVGDAPGGSAYLSGTYIA